MILVADSGSTKTEWSCIAEQSTTRFNTIGMNPYFVTEEMICKEIRNNFPTQYQTNDIDAIYFFGSGCGREESKAIVRNALQAIFVHANITVDSDLVGAAIANYGNEQGIISILGTGMNIGYWDGQSVHTPLPSLGFILGDAGSGSALGKTLIKNIFERQMTSQTTEAFFNQYKLTVTELLEAVYKRPRPNAYLASFVPFIAEHKDLEDIQLLIRSVFANFTNIYAKQIAADFQSDKIAFVGSIAKIFQNELRESLQTANIQLTKISSHPIEGMEIFFKNDRI